MYDPFLYKARKNLFHPSATVDHEDIATDNPRQAILFSELCAAYASPVQCLDYPIKL